MKILGEKIKEYRVSLKMTQAEFARRLGVTGSSVSAYENGTRLPSYDILVRIANILGVSTDALLGRAKDCGTSLDITALNDDQRRIVQQIVELCVERNHLNVAAAAFSAAVEGTAAARVGKAPAKRAEGSAAAAAGNA